MSHHQSVHLTQPIGQLSLHHPRVVHGSGPNRSDRRRVGFAIQSYITPAVEQVIGKIWVQTARGTDFGGHHTEAPRTTAEMAPEDIAAVYERLARDRYRRLNPRHAQAAALSHPAPYISYVRAPNAPVASESEQD
jgi:ectoine hydroxylase-related dioxygenase (phytanoyl-CoA dioxygenase family)